LVALGTGLLRSGELALGPSLRTLEVSETPGRTVPDGL